MIFGISGKAQSGKDTVGAYLEKKYGFTRVASADYLKEVVKNALGWDGLKDERGRKLLQEVGCAVRNYDEDFWISRTIESIKDLTVILSLAKGMQTDFVVTDVRFRNEADMLKAHDAILLRLERDGIVKYDHVSETDLDDYGRFDFVVPNNESFDELYGRIDKVIGLVKWQRKN